MANFNILIKEKCHRRILILIESKFSHATKACVIAYVYIFAAVVPYGNRLYTYKFKSPFFQPR